MSCLYAVREITKRIINPVLSIFLFFQTQKDYLVRHLKSESFGQSEGSREVMPKN